jgi:hypothetical protein
MKYLENSNSRISMTKAILIFYLVIGNNFTADLYSGQLVDFIRTNRIAKHLIGLMTMILIITHMGGINNPSSATVYSLFSYALFLLTTKMDLKWSITTLGLFMLGYLYENKLVDKEKSSSSDKSLEKKDKRRIKNRHDIIKGSIVMSIIGITLMGMYQYFNKKQIQYGGQFDSIKFVLDGK